MTRDPDTPQYGHAGPECRECGRNVLSERELRDGMCPECEAENYRRNRL